MSAPCQGIPNPTLKEREVRNASVRTEASQEKDRHMTSVLAVLGATDPSLITVGGLPLHPLAVHAAVVLLPLSAMGLIALILKPSLRSHYLWMVAGALVAGVGASVVAVQAGKQLAVVTGITDEHRRYGDMLQIVALALLVVGAWWLWQQRIHHGGRAQINGATVLGKGSEPLAAVGTLVLSAVALVLTALVGHSGATAVWDARINAPMPTPTGTATSSVITASTLSKHASATDCWSAVNGKVYDLTDWINKHPGGAGFIQGMCGINASAAFDGQHSGQQRPAQFLASYQVGVFGGASSTSSAPAQPVNALTMAGVQSHNTAAACWTIVKGNIYNLTSWISRHPGGPGVIQGMCGIDASAAFTGQHGNQGNPNQTLNSYLLGALKA